MIKTELGANASATEQTDAWVCFEVSGKTVVDLCERLTPAPARKMTAGEALRTILHHMGCFLICLQLGETMRFLGPRPSATSLHHALKDAALSVF